MSDTYSLGMAFVTWALFGLLALIAWLEWVCEVMHWPSLSYRVEEWSLKNPWFSGGLILLVGVFLAHFLLNPLPRIAAGF